MWTCPNSEKCLFDLPLGYLHYISLTCPCLAPNPERTIHRLIYHKMQLPKQISKWSSSIYYFPECKSACAKSPKDWHPKDKTVQPSRITWLATPHLLVKLVSRHTMHTTISTLMPSDCECGAGARAALYPLFQPNNPEKTNLSSGGIKMTVNRLAQTRGILENNCSGHKTQGKCQGWWQDA